MATIIIISASIAICYIARYFDKSKDNENEIKF